MEETLRCLKAFQNTKHISWTVLLCWEATGDEKAVLRGVPWSLFTVRRAVFSECQGDEDVCFPAMKKHYKKVN